MLSLRLKVCSVWILDRSVTTHTTQHLFHTLCTSMKLARLSRLLGRRCGSLGFLGDKACGLLNDRACASGVRLSPHDSCANYFQLCLIF